MSVDPAFACDRDSLRAGVGTATFLRGLACADGGAVRQVAWREPARVLVGSVTGSRGEQYLTTVHFDRSEPARFQRAECSCPMRHDCKHGVALALVASREAATTPPPPAAPTSWETPWQSLLGTTPDDLSQAGRHTLAIELSLTRTPTNRWDSSRLAGSLELTARLVRNGRKGWIAGGLAWGRLVGLQFHADYDPEQVRVLADLHALYRARTGSGWNGYANYGEDRAIELSAVTSGALFPLLSAGLDAGIRLVHAGSPTSATCRRSSRPSCAWTSPHPTDPTAACASPPCCASTAAYGAVVPVAFLGNGIGAVVRCPPASRRADRRIPASWPLRLVTLAAPAPAAVRRMALGTAHPPCPPQHHDRFLDEYFPQLRQLARSSPPTARSARPGVSHRRCCCRRLRRGARAWRCGGSWAYDVGEHDAALPLTPATRQRLPRPGRGGGPAGRFRRRRSPPTDSTTPRQATASLIGGMDTMQFTTEWLPLLRNRRGRAGARSPARPPTTARPATPCASRSPPRPRQRRRLVRPRRLDHRRRRDRAVPGGVHRARQGKSHLLLPGGAYFSLEKPRTARAAPADRRGPGAVRQPRTARCGSAGTRPSLWDELVGLGVVDRQAARWRKHVAA